MKKRISVLILILIAQVGLAQTNFWKSPYSGVNFNLNLPAIRSVSGETLSMKSEWGTALFFEFGNKKQWAHQTSLGFDRVEYNHNFEHKTTLNNSLTFGLSSFYSPKKMQGTRLFFGLEPAYVLSRKTKNLDGSKGAGIVQKSHEIDRPFDLGIKAGISLEFKPHIALNVSYKEMLHGVARSSDYDGIPDQIQISLQINFSKIKNVVPIDYHAIAKSEAKRLRDSSILLFVIESHQTEINNEPEGPEKEALIAKIKESKEAQIYAIKNYYKYSEFAICEDKNLRALLDGENDVELLFHSNYNNSNNFIGPRMFVARIGDFILATNQSPRSGVFIFDNGMNLYKAPFPYFTSYVGLESYLGDDKKLFAMISNLNEKLILFNQSN
jgi:hypothetical protein